MADRLRSGLVFAQLIEALTPAVRQAGSLIEGMKAKGVAERQKSDRSPVTEADEAAERLLENAIREVDPDAVIVGEEAAAVGKAPVAGSADRYWLIDPLDGTRDFIKGGVDYSVNVGLVEGGLPILGLVLHPPTGTLWTGAPGLGAWKETAAHSRHSIRVRAMPDPPIIATSRSHLDPRTSAWVALVPNAVVHPTGSSLKLCLIAEGTADVYPRYGRTCEWDTAAADAILRAAGGLMLMEGGAPFIYGKPEYLNPGFIAFGDHDAPGILPPFGK